MIKPSTPATSGPTSPRRLLTPEQPLSTEFADRLLADLLDGISPRGARA
nr:hypothetical protein [Nonomuraea pusilla]